MIGDFRAICISNSIYFLSGNTFITGKLTFKSSQTMN